MYQVRERDDYSEISVSRACDSENQQNDETDVNNQQHFQCGCVVCVVGTLILYDSVIITALMLGYDNLHESDKTTEFLIVSSIMTALWTCLIVINALVMSLCNWGREFFVSLITMRVVFSFVLMIVYIGFFLATPEWQNEKSLVFVMIVYVILLFACCIQVTVSMFRCYH